MTVRIPDAFTSEEVDVMLQFLLDMAKTYARAVTAGLFPQGLNATFPDVADSFGAFDPETLASETRAPKLRPDPKDIDEADAVWRVAIRCLSREQLWWVMIAGPDGWSDRKRGRIAGLKHETLRRYQREAAQDVVKFLCVNNKSWTSRTVSGSVLDSLTQGARDVA